MDLFDPLLNLLKQYDAASCSASCTTLCSHYYNAAEILEKQKVLRTRTSPLGFVRKLCERYFKGKPKADRPKVCPTSDNGPNVAVIKKLFQMLMVTGHVEMNLVNHNKIFVFIPPRRLMSV